MNINTIKYINAKSLHELARLIQLPDTDLDNHILKTREKFMEHKDSRISEALPKIIKDADMESLMLGAIIMCFTSDYTFRDYLEREIELIDGDDSDGV